MTNTSILPTTSLSPYSTVQDNAPECLNRRVPQFIIVVVHQPCSQIVEHDTVATTPNTSVPPALIDPRQ